MHRQLLACMFLQVCFLYPVF